MQRRLRLAGIGCAIFAFTSCMFLSIFSVVPWEQPQLGLLEAYILVSVVCITILTRIQKAVLARSGKWANSKMRWLGVSLVGASMGLFVLGWISILAPPGLEAFKTNEFEKFLCGVGPEPLWVQARQLMPQAELLAACSLLIENCMQFAAGFALFAIIAVSAYDASKASSKA